MTELPDVMPGFFFGGNLISSSCGGEGKRGLNAQKQPDCTVQILWVFLQPLATI